MRSNRCVTGKILELQKKILISIISNFRLFCKKKKLICLKFTFVIFKITTIVEIEPQVILL